MKKLTHKDYVALLKWATNEVKEWQKFIKDLKKSQKQSKGSDKRDFGEKFESIKHIGNPKDFPKNWGKVKIGGKLVKF